jgi:hypothetical protein
MELTLEKLDQTVKEWYGDNELAAMEMLLDMAKMIEDRAAFRNENQTFSQLLQYAYKSIEEVKGMEAEQTVVSTENGWFIDRLRNGEYQVTLHEKVKGKFASINEAVNYMIVKLN